MACTLKSWQVKTICPVRPSALEGKGIVNPPVEPPGVALGVATDSVITGEENPEGVEACSVANRSGVGEEAIGRLHPISKKMRRNVRESLNLLIIEFNGLKIKLFTR